jgi:isocitrate dehydrogenase
VLQIIRGILVIPNYVNFIPYHGRSWRRLELQMIDNRGVKVWPDGMAETLCTDAYPCRFSAKGGPTHKQTVALLSRVLDQGIEIVKTETLRSFDGVAGYTLAQGQ